jgi:hypothetical protein
MSEFSQPVWIRVLAISAIVLFHIGGKTAQSSVSQSPENAGESESIGVVIWTSQTKYSMSDDVRVNVSLENIGHKPIYVDRRMFWGGLAGGLKIMISDEQGKPVPFPMFPDALMPPPKKGDTSILIRLDEGFFYGTWVNLPAKEWFPQPGRYSIRIIYKSLLHKEFVEPQLRALPAIWADTPPMPSAPVWIDVTH